MKNNTIVAAVLVAMTIGGGTAVLAGRGPDDNCGSRPGPAMHEGRFLQRMAKVLKLTDAQQSQIKSLFSSERVAAEPLRAQLHEKRQQLRKAGESTSFDEAFVRSTAAAIGQIQTELAVIRVKTRTQIHALLTPEQRELAKSLKPSKERAHRPRHQEGMTDGEEEQNDL
ncbi:Spy/CpxP family protein refolding chaperone [Geotalea sp. SG265]|uniref:Spy/CpxP family protein refolding chaperone n=1 Tax=Geotalea sp. SG265 TaxID=2922867 RepID=UPI001FAF0C64|nr:Spy/CpxP family protein refolding chaperone [Geotalea sp. SG265]